MIFKHILTRSFERDQSPGDSLTQRDEITADAEDNREIAVPNDSVPVQVSMAIDVSALKSLYIKSDQDVTLETNSSSTPDDTINLIANQVLLWSVNDYAANPFASAVDVVNLFFTNSGGSAATVSVRVLQDSTP